MIDPTLCKHNIVNNGECMMCKTKINKTQQKIIEAIDGIEAKRQDPGYVSPLRSETHGCTHPRTYPDTTAL
jgi:hypothetical protein